MGHFDEAMKCCNEALKVEKDCSEILYRRSQTILYNLVSNPYDLGNAYKDAEKILNEKPNDERYQDNLKIIKDRINDRIELQKRIIKSIMESTPSKIIENDHKDLLKKY